MNVGNTEIKFEIRNQLEIKVICRAWKSQKSGLKSVEIRNQLEIKSKSRTRFQQVLDPRSNHRLYNL